MSNSLRGYWEGSAGMGVAAVAGVITEVSATTRELPSEEVSESVLSPPVSSVVLPWPSVPLVPSGSGDSVSWILWDADPSIAGASAPPPDDANAHKGRMTKQESGGERQRIHWVNGCTNTTVAVHSTLTHREQAYALILLATKA
ncbi:hypothetical protein NDU88_005409 [Pleurodeles waltl]|uniref:Uncharacterized protein n=1 Tax=Pleurodeles waltl TaxID=8319 RepID=A0AAV7VN53_PLEWA|nr:hypothetical protein NDU88_005409 [Pleurodeles waltl]